MRSLYSCLRDSGVAARLNEPLKRHTTMRVGGPADVYARPSSAEQIKLCVETARELGADCVIIGKGSNIIFRDGGFRGLVVELGDAFSEVTLNGNVIKAQAGASLSRLSTIAMNAGLGGLEFAHGIPGSVGGGVAMNAGAYGGEIKDVLSEAALYGADGLVTLSREEMRMGYRTTRAIEEGMTVLEAVFILSPGDAREIAETAKVLDEKRRAKQPLNYPSAGSTFKRPEGYFAGALIEDAGLKGARVGGACVSQKHAGFIINDSDASAKDVIELIELVQKRVFQSSGVVLEREVRVMGAD